MGYVLGGLYFSSDSNILLGKFFQLAEIPSNRVEELLPIAQLYAIACYIFFFVGYLCGDDGKGIIPGISRYDLFVSPSVIHIFAWSSLVLGFSYWLYSSYFYAGGPIQMLKNFSVFIYLLRENPLSTLPYHFYFVGSYLLYFYYCLKGSRIPYHFILVVAIGALIIVSKGRISASLMYVLSFVVLSYFYAYERISNARIISAITLGFVAIIVVLFLRIASSYNYVGLENPFGVLANMREMINALFQVLVGWGNVADIQQMVLILQSWDGLDKALLGASYLDWARNLLSDYLGMEPISVGMRVLQLYFPSKVGGPTPGAIGEAYVNMLYGGPFIIFLVGFIFSRMYSLAASSTSFGVRFFYAIFLLNFVFMFAKVDSSLLSNVFWSSVPTLIVLSCILMLSRLGVTKGVGSE